MIKNKFIIVFLFLFFSINVFSAGTGEHKPVDLRILVDISEQSKKAFPELEFIGALELLLDRLPDGSKAGIWSYGKYVNHLVKHETVDDTWRNHAKRQLQTIKPVALHRNLQAVMRKASLDFRRSDGGYQRVILLLSAGGINLYSGADANALERHELLRQELPKLRQAGYIIHTLSLSEQADQELLITLAKETSGFSLTANDQESLLQAMLMLSQNVAQQNYIPIENDQVAIDADVKAFTALFVGPAAGQRQLAQAPNGKTIEWIAEKNYTLKRFNAPSVGPWQLPAGLSKLSRIYVETEAGIAVDSLKPVYAVGERPSVDIQQAEADIAVVLHHQGSEVYQQLLTENETRLPSFSEAGQYQLTVIQKNQGHQRAVDYPVQVYPLLNMAIKTKWVENKKRYLITMMSKDRDIQINKSRLNATITDSAGKQQVRTISQNNDQQWELALTDDGDSTEYRVQFEFTGVTTTGRNINFKPKPILIELRKALAPSQITFDTEVAEQQAPIVLPERLSSELIEPEDVADTGNIWLLVVMGITLAGGLGLLGFYFWPKKKLDASLEEGEEA